MVTTIVDLANAPSAGDAPGTPVVCAPPATTRSCGCPDRGR